MKSCGCVAVYTDTLQVFLRALETPVHRPMLHAGKNLMCSVKMTSDSLSAAMADNDVLPVYRLVMSVSLYHVFMLTAGPAE